MEKEILVVDNLCKVFKNSNRDKNGKILLGKKKIAVDNLSFIAYEGEIYGLLGPNGAGKTTTLRMLATLIKPDSGHVKILGIDTVEQPEAVRNKIGFLTSELKLDGFLTPNYLFDFFSELYSIDHDICEKRKTKLFQKFGIDGFADVKVCNLSSGMKQKISLVVSLVNDPQIIIFDEPTNGLDIVTAKSLSAIGLISGLSSFIGILFALPKMVKGVYKNSEITTGVYTSKDYLLLFIVILSTVLVIVGIISIISGIAKSVKEAGVMTMPLMAIVMIIAAGSMLGNEPAEGLLLYTIPFYNSVQCMYGIFSFKLLPMNLVVTITMNFVYTIIMIWILTKIFNSEKIIYNQ